jgi:putative transport protein
MAVDTEALGLIRDAGLALFVFAIGLEVGPSFFSSFKKEGLRMNITAVSLILLDIVVAIILYLIFSD